MLKGHKTVGRGGGLRWCVAEFATIGLVAALSMLLLVAAAVAQTEDEVVVTALHAIPGENDFPADVYIDGGLAIEGFTKMTRTDPFTMPPGDITIAIYPTGSDPTGTDPALEESLTLEAGTNLTVVALLNTEGEPVLAVFANDTGTVAAGQGRFVFRQTSSTGPVDVVAGGEVLFDDVEPLEEVATEIPAGTLELEVVDASADVLAEADVEVREGELTALYAVDTNDGEGLLIATQSVAGLGVQPMGIPTGNGGLAATGTTSFPWVAAILVLIAVVIGGARWSRSARRRRLDGDMG